MIDAGEKWAAVLGIGCVLSREVEKITKAQRLQVEGLEIEVARLAEKLCRGTINITWPKCANAKKADEQLRTGFTESQVSAMIADIPPEAQTQYMTVAKREFDFLGMAFPREKLDGTIAPIEIPKNDTDYYKFYGMYRVIDDPLYVFRLMSTGGMLTKQAQAVRAVFPSLATFIDECITEAFEGELVKDRSFRLPLLVDTGIRDWKELPIVLKPYQLAIQQEAETMDKPAPKAGESPESKGSLSAAQSALYSSVTGKA